MTVITVNELPAALGQESSSPAKEVTTIDLPFAAVGLAISADGTKAAVWNRFHRQQEPQSLAVIDLPDRKLVAQRFLRDSLADVVFGSDVYVADLRSVRRLSVDRLELLAEHGLRSANKDLMLVGNQRLSVGPWSRLSLPDLVLIDNYDHDVHSPEERLDGRCGFGWMEEGVLWDKSLTKPLLLVWPFEFERVPQRAPGSGRGEPGPFEATAGAWHPFSSQLSARPDRAVTAIVDSADIAAKLGIFHDAGGTRLGSFRLDNGQLIASIVIAPSDKSSDNSSTIQAAIATGGELFGVLLNGRLIVGPIRALQADNSAVPFHLAPRQSVFVLEADRPTTVRYEAAGATRFHLTRRLPGREGQVLELTSENGEFTLSAAEALDSLVNSAAGLAANLNKGRDLPDNRQRAEFFAGPSRLAFRRLFGRDANGVPLPMTVQVTAERADGATAELQHDFLVEVPLPQLEAAMDAIYPYARDPWRKSTTFDLTNYPDSASPPPEQNPASNYLRRLWNTPHPQVSGEELLQAAKLAKDAGDQRLHERYVRWFVNRHMRAWTDPEGRQIEASFARRSGDQITLRLTGLMEITVPEAKLSEADRRFLRELAELQSPGDGDSWREFVFAESAGALSRIHGVPDSFPPFALCDATGWPRLSWRVVLLRELGYTELFELFHMDEPWNSAHNRKLIPFMPNLFATDIQQAAEGRTSLATISGPTSVMQIGRMIDRRSFGGDESSMVLLVETAPSRVMEWSKPADPGLDEFADPTAVIHARDGKTWVGLLDGRARQVPADISRDDWRAAVSRGFNRQLLHELSP